MKIMLFLILILSISCQKQNKDKIKNIKADTLNALSSLNNNNQSKYYINVDTLLITSDLGDTLKLEKNTIIKLLIAYLNFLKHFHFQLMNYIIN